MSSAAVQQSGPSISSRTQFQQPSSSSHARDYYHHHHHNHNHNNNHHQPQQTSSSSAAAAAGPHQTSSPSQQPRASRRPSGNGECTPQQPHHYSPSTSNASDATTPRPHPHPHPNPGPTSNHASPTSTPSAYNPQAGPVPPPRTSSTHKATAAPQDPHTTTSSRPPSSRAASQHMRDDPAQAAANAANAANAAHRRRSHQSSNDPSSYHPPAASKNSPSHSRSATAVGSTPMGSNLPREDSTVINRLVIADPSDDFAREQARMVETRPQQPGGTDITPITGLGLVGSEGVDDGGRGAGKTRQDHSRDKPRRETKFGDYILGQTLGEGEFGKVKMGWKKDGGVQVAIKLIRREVLGSNPSRLPKIYREISILRGLQHPNIVRLHEMVETERHIGIILEYASGGELFDYILNHRYLKDNSARRLFAQLVSGVGYLHKKGIVHRDLKLENLLLDRNKNIIITDFGFANTFDPNDDLGDEIEYNLGNKDFVKKMGLDLVGDSGHRRGDLMQTSCGSPCYAAPELVVSDSLYTGRKVDVWSCGVILYAMLAGYLPFDDDPANPEGDNINLLYKYIVSTPLTFPEYVTPHARDLLKRILVPDPRKRADLFEVARHSWLSEYAHVVGFITSSTTTSSDIANTTVPAEDPYEVPQLARSASVREASKPTHVSISGVGGLHQKHGHIDQADTGSQAKRDRDAKRRTVQVEYVAPHTQTQRGEASPPIGSSSGAAASQGGASRTRLRVENQGPVEVPSTDGYMSASANPNRMSTGAVSAAGVPPTRPTRENQRAVSDVPFSNQPTTSSARPSTGGTMSGSSRLPSRGNSYGQPVAATVAATNAQGRFSQPKGKQYVISAPMAQDPAQQEAGGGRSSTSQRDPSSTYQPVKTESSTHSNRISHRRSNTVSGFGEKIFRASGIFSSGKPAEPSGQKQKSHPPVSMASSIPSEGSGGNRRSAESSRRTSFSFNRKTSENAPARDRSSRRFSLLPAAFSMKSFATNKESGAGDRRSYQPPTRPRAPSRTQMSHGRESPSPSPSTTNSTLPIAYNDELERQRTTSTRDKRRSGLFSGLQASAPSQPRYPAPTSYPNHGDEGPQSQHGGYYNRNESEQRQQQAQQLPHRPQYPPGFDSNEQLGSEPSQGRARVLQKNRRFADAYEDQQRYAGSSGAARRVMDLFRRRGKARGG